MVGAGRWLGWGAAAGGVALGCGGIAVMDGAEGGGGQGAQGAAAGTGGTGAAGGSGGSGGSGGLTICGGEAGLICGDGFYCDFQPSRCGGDDSTGLCRLQPDGCPTVYRPVCGCDGSVYGNDCEASVAGVDVDWSGGCPPPPAMFPCGVGFCDAGLLFCRISLNDIAGADHEYGCLPYPPGCGAEPSCACLANVACGQWCSDDGAGNLTVTCPGG